MENKTKQTLNCIMYYIIMNDEKQSIKLTAFT